MVPCKKSINFVAFATIGLCLINSIIGIGQVQDGNSVLLQEVIIDSLPLSKGEIRDKSKEWIGKTFKSGKDVISSETDGSIVGHFITHTTGSMDARFTWDNTITIDFKDSKVRVKIWVDKMLDTGYAAASYWFGPNKPKKIHARWLEEMTLEAKGFIESLNAHLISKDDF